MAFDFINQAIDKVVGAGKAVKDVATTAVEDWKTGADRQVYHLARNTCGTVYVQTAPLAPFALSYMA